MTLSGTAQVDNFTMQNFARAYDQTSQVCAPGSSVYIWTSYQYVGDWGDLKGAVVSGISFDSGPASLWLGTQNPDSTLFQPDPTKIYSDFPRGCKLLSCEHPEIFNCGWWGNFMIYSFKIPDNYPNGTITFSTHAGLLDDWSTNTNPRWTDSKQHTITVQSGSRLLPTLINTVTINTPAQHSWDITDIVTTTTSNVPLNRTPTYFLGESRAGDASHQNLYDIGGPDGYVEFYMLYYITGIAPWTTMDFTSSVPEYFGNVPGKIYTCDLLGYFEW